MRVVLHGFGSFPIIFWHMIQYARSVDLGIEWGIILASDHHQKLFTDLLGADSVVVLNKGENQIPSCGQTDLHYPGALFKDIEAEKRTFKYAPASIQLRRALSMYQQVARFMERFTPTHALVSQVEGFDGKAFITAARECGAEVVVPTGCRNLGGIFFSPDDLESLPAYAAADAPGCQDAARAFVTNFRESPTPARRIHCSSNDEILSEFKLPLPVRAAKALKRWLGTSGGFERDYLRASLLNNLPIIRDAIWGFRRQMNQRYCDVRTLDELPKRFIFYPLQSSPESSINTPAPYFLDQFRAIDAIRYAMPSDCVLVVKEHPAFILLRDASFVKRLQRTAGVVVAHYSMPSIELVKRAGLTISVTGTATLEAMLLGKHAITLGHSLVSGCLGGVCALDQLPLRIAASFAKTIPEDEIIVSLACLFSVRHEVVFGSPGSPGEPVLRRKNVERFTEAFIQHCRFSENSGRR